MAPVNFWIAEESRFLNSDFVCKNIKIFHSVSDVSLKMPPKIRFCKVVLENQVRRGLKNVFKNVLKFIFFRSF